jgi:GNAT superfamily N-acetyltransferase
VTDTTEVANSPPDSDRSAARSQLPSRGGRVDQGFLAGSGSRGTSGFDHVAQVGKAGKTPHQPVAGGYASTRAAELELTNWSDAQKLEFTDSQSDFQHQHYRTYYPATKWSLLEDNGVPMGRLYLEPRASTLLVIDIALLPQWRGRGLGTALLECVRAQAHAAGKSVTVAVEKDNRAQTLYRRLGFREIGDHGVHWDMEWGAADQRTNVI